MQENDCSQKIIDLTLEFNKYKQYYDNIGGSGFFQNSLKSFRHFATHPEKLTERQKVSVNIAHKEMTDQDFRKSGAFELVPWDNLKILAGQLNVALWDEECALAKNFINGEIFDLSDDSRNHISAYIAQYHSDIYRD